MHGVLPTGTPQIRLRLHANVAALGRRVWEQPTPVVTDSAEEWLRPWTP